jgi:hypothetical protein
MEMKMYRRRSSAYSTRKKRTKKIRPLVRMKEKLAKKGGRCSGCRARYEVGDPVTVVVTKRRTYHRATCVPQNALQTPNNPYLGPPAASPTEVVRMFSSKWSVGESKMVAMLGLENAMVVLGRALNFPKEFEDAFEKYNKFKEHVLRPGSEQEGKQAAKLAVIALVKTVF